MNKADRKSVEMDQRKEKKIYQEDHQVSPENTGRISKVLIKIQ